MFQVQKTVEVPQIEYIDSWKRNEGFAAFGKHLTRVKVRGIAMLGASFARQQSAACSFKDNHVHIPVQKQRHVPVHIPVERPVEVLPSPVCDF